MLFFLLIDVVVFFFWWEHGGLRCFRSGLVLIQRFFSESLMSGIVSRCGDLHLLLHAIAILHCYTCFGLFL